MTSKNTESITLLTDLYLKQDSIARIYSYVGLPNSEHNLVNPKVFSNVDKKIFSVSNVPNYLKKVRGESSDWTEKIYPSVAGYSISIGEYSNVEDYMRAQLKNRRKAINRALRRLETCFDISYQMFQQDIKQDQFNFLMSSLKSMIEKRFEQKRKTSDNLAAWDKVMSSSFQLMKQGKASIFVIYDKDLPIEISFNYNYGTILFSYISSYDIDYGKFSLGQVEIYKQLEWCIQNGYTHFEMGWGDMAYKRQWSNAIYQFNHHIFYPKNSLPGLLYAFRKGNRSRILAFLISKGVNTRWNNFKEKLKGSKENLHNGPIYKFESMTISSAEDLEEIDLGKQGIPVNKRIVNDFLFLTQEHVDNITLSYSRPEDHYILKGKKEAKSIQFNTTNH